MESAEKMEKKDKIALMAEVIRRNSAEIKLTPIEDLTEPLELEVDKIKEMSEKLQEDENYRDIQLINGAKTSCFFSNKYMTKSYALLLARINEKDLLTLVAETVREESRIYPRPTDIRIFSGEPFFLSKEELEEILNQINNRADFADIKEVKASNGAVYLYSEKYMNKNYARSLAEFVEVIQPEIP